MSGSTVLCVLVATLVLLASVGSSNATQTARQRAIDCALRYVDVAPKDGGITPDEIGHAKDTILTRVQRSMAVVATTGMIMNDCDFDHDGKITRSDMERAVNTCLKEPWKLNMFLTYVCNQAAAQENSLH